jgi:glycosyltransferase involved in cell wall biosynthesis
LRLATLTGPLSRSCVRRSLGSLRRVQPPLISVVTASLNQADYLERTLQSVAEQDYPTIEHIVVDGGSTDGSVEILERWTERLARWVSEPDSGQANAINKGLGWASGDIVAYINSDDYYLPGAFAAAALAFEDPRIQWAAGRCRYEHTDGSLERLVIPEPPRMPRRTMIAETWYVPQASSFWRRQVFIEMGALREDLHYVFDLEFGLRCALAGTVPSIMDADIAVRYLHDEAKSASPEPFARESAQVQHELERAHVTAVDRVVDIAYRARRGAIRVLRSR